MFPGIRRKLGDNEIKLWITSKNVNHCKSEKIAFPPLKRAEKLRSNFSFVCCWHLMLDEQPPVAAGLNTGNGSSPFATLAHLIRIWGLYPNNILLLLVIPISRLISNLSQFLFSLAMSNSSRVHLNDIMNQCIKSSNILEPCLTVDFGDKANG